MATLLVQNGVVVKSTQFDATYHLGTDNTVGEILFFYAHKDKTPFETVIFYPLGGSFWTVIAVPKGTKMPNFKSCNKQYVEWKQGPNIGEKSRERLQHFENNFHLVAGEEVGTYEIHHFLLDASANPLRRSFLRFPAQWIHGTISFGKERKELLVIVD